MALSGRTLLIGLLFLAHGCAGLKALSPKTSFDGKDSDAIVVLRVSPRALVCISKGRVEKYGWRAKGGCSQFWPEDGFLVIKAAETDEGEGYGVISITPEKFASPAEGTVDDSMARWPRHRYVGAIVMNPLLGAAMADVAPPSYYPKAHVRLPVFRTVAGKVAYVGAIGINARLDPESSEHPKKIGITATAGSLKPEDRAAIAQYLAKHYPKVSAELVLGTIEMLPRNEYTDFE